MHSLKTKHVVFSVCALAAASGADTLCYSSGNPSGFFDWSETARWVTQNGGSVGSAVNRLPTTADTVNIWGGGLAKPEQALCINSGTAAETGDFVLGQWAGGGAVTYFNIAGGSLTNAGTVRVGYHTDGSHHAVATVKSGGEWNVGGKYFYLGQSKAANSVTVEGGGTLRQTSADSEFDVGHLSGYSGIVTNAGSVALYNLHCGTVGHGSWVNPGALAVENRFLCGGHGADNSARTGTGVFENRGSVTIGKSTTTGVFVLGWNPGSTGTFIHENGSISFPRAETADSSYWPVVGRYGTGRFVVRGDLALGGSGWQLNMGSVSGGSGTLRVENGASLSGLRILRAGAAGGGSGRVEVDGAGSTLEYRAAQIGSNNDKAVGRVVLSGGSFSAGANAAQIPLVVGRLATAAANDGIGEIRGWGKVTHSNAGDASADRRIQLRGQIVADGGGEPHDLDCGGFIRTSDYATDPNPAGRTNGWYAVRGGRLIYPRSEALANASLITIGDWPYCGTPSDLDRPEPTLVNSLQLRLFDSSGEAIADGNYNYAMLYAADRGDIPGVVPGSGSGEKTLGVWRLGHFSDSGDVGANPVSPVPFGTCTLRFRLDDSGLGSIDWTEFSVVLFRWDGSAWKRVGKASSGEMPYIGTAAPQERYTANAGDNWNVGWYCAALVRNSPFVLVIR